MKHTVDCFQRGVFSIFFICLTRCTSASSCTGQNYVVPEYLRCTPVNVAYNNNGAQCVDASDSLATCGLALDGSAATEWTYSGAGVGMWLKIQFDRQYLINTLRVKQRANAIEQNKGLKLTFMDGSEAFVELTKNEGVTYDQEAVWDIRSFCDVMTNFVKVEVETVYTVVNNGFKEIQFYHDNCLTDKLESFLTIPMGKTTEIHPVQGKSISLRIKATKNVAVTLYEKPKADSARYRFIIFDQNGNSQIRRAAEGDSNDNQQKWTSTPNALGPDPKWRTIWIDFRSSNLVLGSGGEVLLQWNDPSPISVSYVSFTADATMSTTIYYYNRETESKCFKDADHFWPLDKSFFRKDLIGSTHGKCNSWARAAGPGYEGLSTRAAVVQSAADMTIDFGDFSGDCIGDFARCEKGITVAFWLKVTAGVDSDILYSAEKDSDRGLTIFYLTDTSLLTVNMYSTNEYGSVSVKITPEVWYHVFVAWKKGTAGNPWMVINGAEVFWGTVQAESRTQESYTHLLVGQRPTGGTSNFKISQLVIWRKALGRRDMQRVFHCVGLQPEYPACASIEVNDRVTCGWVDIMESYCNAIGCCYQDNTCFKQDGRSDFSKLGVGSGSSGVMSASSYTPLFNEYLGRLMWRSATDSTWVQHAWKPMSTTGDQWLQVDLDQVKTVRAVATKGYSHGDMTSCCQTYTLRYSKSGAIWELYKENNAVKVFMGNTDATTVVKNNIATPFVARKVRFHVKSWFNEPALKVEVYGSKTAVNYMGCYTGGTFKPCGSYGRHSLTPEICTTCCGIAGYSYSAVRRGDQCFCCDAVDALKKVGDPQCDDPCTGNSVLRCGGRDAYSVYQALGDYNYPFELTMATNVSLSDSINATFTSYPGASYKLDFGEDIVITSWEPMVSYLYHSDGPHVVYGHAMLGEYGEAQSFLTSLPVNVYSSVKLFEPNCPAVVEANEEFGCRMSIYEGADMRLDAQFTSGSIVSTPLDDARSCTVGQLFQTTPGGAGIQTTNKTVLIPSYRFEDDGKLTGWRICSETSGYVTLQIFRPVCGKGPHSVYCYVGGNCETGLAPCANASTFSCTSSEVFAMGSSFCTDSNLSPGSIPTAGLNDRYELITKSHVFVATPGCHIFPFDDIKNCTDVKEGDILGFTYQGSGFAEITSRAGGESKQVNATGFCFNDVKLTLGTILNTNELPPSSVSGLEYSLAAVHSIPSVFWFPHTYAIGQYNEEATVSGPWKTVKQQMHITATESVANVTMTTPKAVATNASFVITIHPHKGYNITYVVNYGAGENESFFTVRAEQDQQLGHEFSLSGTYTVSLHASNILSFAIKTCTVVVQDSILGLALYRSILPVALGNETVVQWYMRQGDGVNITVNFGDGTSFQNGSFDVAYLFAAMNTYTYAAVGEYVVTINVSNCVSNASIEGLAVVELPVTGVSCDVIHAHRDIEVNETVTVQVTTAQGTNPEIFIDFGDGSVTTTRQLSVQHSYSIYDFYNVSCSVYNNVSRVNVSTNIQVHKPVDPLIGFNLTCSCTNLTDLTSCMLNISIGTDFVCRWDWGDGSFSETVYEQLGNFTHHNYSAVGHYSVSLNCSNRLNETTAVTTAIVEEPIVGFAVVEPVAKPFATDFQVTWSTVTGTDAIFNVTFTHITSGTCFNVTVTTTSERTSGSALISAAMMPDIGIYELKVTAVNCVTPPQTISLLVLVDVPINTPLLNRSSKFVQVHTTANFSCQMAAGSNVSLWWDFGDSSSVVYQYHQGNFSSEGVLIGHDFTQAGEYTVTLFGNNSLGNFTLHIPIYIQNPHYLVLTTNSPQELPPGIITFHVCVAPGKEHPTNSNYTVHYGDGQSDAGQHFSAPLILQHSYGEHGAYTMNITFTNDVHFVSLETVVEVQVPIENFQAFSSHTAPEKNKGKPGVGPRHTYFPCDFPVHLNSTKDRGTNVSYAWNFGDSKSELTTNTSVNHTFPNPGHYIIKVVATNAVSNDSQELTVDIQCMVKITKFTNDGQGKLGLPITFTVDIAQVGTASCFLVEIGDDLAMNFRRDTSVTCPKDCSRSGEEVRPITDPTRFSWKRICSEEGVKPVKITACNVVSLVTESGNATCAAKRCKYPNVTMDQEVSGDSPKNAKLFFSWKQITVKNVIKLDCEASDQTAFSWRVCKMDSRNQSCMPFQLTASVTVTNSKLALQPRVLPYGVFYLEFTCTMVGVEGIYSFSYGYIAITPSPIEALIDGGTSRAIGHGKKATISSLSTRDPDVVNNHPSDFKRCWFCAKHGSYDHDLLNNCTELPAFPLTPISQPSAGNETQSNSTVIDENGCFGYPSGRLNASTPEITFSTIMMQVGCKYDVCVQAMKDTRRSISCTTIEILEGDPPVVTITCAESIASNCKKRISPSNKLALNGTATCDACSPKTTEYEWKIFRRTISDDWELLTDVDTILSISRFGKQLAVKAGTLIGGITYKFRLESWVRGSRSRGYSEYEKEVNSPAKGGRCQIRSRHTESPELGYAFQPDFLITAFGWQDDTKLVYSVTAQVDSDQPEITVPADATLEVGQEYQSPPLTLPPGLEANDFWIHVFVKITDEDGASITVALRVQVKMPEQNEEEKAAMISNEVNKLQNLFSEGDSAAVLGQIGNLAAAISEPSPELQETLVDFVVQVSIPSNAEDAVRIAGTLRAVANAGSTGTASSNKKMAEAATNCASALERSEMNSEQRKDLSKNLVGTVGSIVVPPTTESQSSSTESDPSDSSSESSGSSETQKKAMKVLDTVFSSVCNTLLPDEEPVRIESRSLSLGASVNLPRGLKRMAVGGSSIDGLDGAVDGNSTEPVQSRMSVFGNNPYGGGVNGGVCQLELRDQNGNAKNVSNLTNYMDIYIPANGGELETIRHGIKRGDLLVITVNVTDNMSAIYVWVVPKHNNTQLVVLCKKNSRPTLEEYDFRQTFSKSSESGNASEANNSSDSSESDLSRFQMFIDNDDLNQTAAGSWFCGFYYNGSAQEDDQENAAEESNFNITIFELACKYLNTTSNKWQYDGCKPGPKTTASRRHCRCNHLTSFASDFFVPPNKIDWSKVSLEELLKNPLVFSVVCGIFGLYFILVLWARRADRKDLEKVGVAPLPDNDPRDTYMYEIVVYTGYANHSGTSSEVRMVLTGGLDETSPRRLKDTEPGRRKFCRGNVDYFLLSVPQCLGKLKSLRIWHDNSGTDPSWYLLRIMVHDLQTDIKTWFICDRWLAVEEDDGMVERTLTPASKEELTSFNLLFSTEARKNLTDNHLWFSVIARPAKSNFTRVQRLSCCLSILLSTMLANAMFYQVGSESSTGTAVHVGPFSFSIKQLSIGITSSLVVLPANVLIVMFFRKARPKEAKVGLDKNQDPHGQSQKYELSGDKAKEKSKEEDVEEDDQDKKKDKKKKKKTLPHFFVYVAYGLVFLTCTVSATFTIFYGLTFGKEKSEGWISSMMISFWQDVLVSQPLKVFAAAMFFALVIKDPNKAEEENEQENNELNPDEEAIHSKKQGSEEEKALRKIGFVDKPPNPEKLEAARLLKVKQKEMKTIIREVIQYFVFLCVLLVIAYGSRDPMAFTVTSAMRNMFEEGRYSGLDGIDGVADYKSYWNWVEETFIPALMPRYWYGPFAIDEEDLVKEEITSQEVVREKNKKVRKTKITVANVEAGFKVLFEYDKGFVADRITAFLVGTARLRQLRMKKGKCKLIPFLTGLFDECNLPYDWDNEESGAFEPHWAPMASNKSTEELEPTAWTYQTQWTLKGTPYWGQFATYWGGGYVADFGNDREKAENLTKLLDSQHWIDRYTRAIFAEFTIYNAQTNFFSVITLLSEILPTGGYYHSPKIQTLRLYRYVGPEMVFVMACEITYMTFLLYYLYKQVKKYRKGRKEYFRDAWNYPELLVLGFSLSAVGLYFARLAITKYSISNMHDTPKKYVSFQYAAFMDEWVSATTGMAVFFSFLKFLRLLKFNRRVSTLIQTIKLAAKPLMSFMLLFFVLFLAFCQFAFLVFGVDNDDYATFPSTLGSMMSLTLGNFDFHALQESSRIIGPVFFFSYVVSVFFVLTNVFIGILNDALSEVANDASIQSNEHEILDFMFHTFKKTVGKQVGPAIKPSYKEPKNQFELNMDSIEEMSENVQYALRNICMEDIRHTTWFEPENASKKKKIMMMLVLETDEDFTENDICDSIPLFDEELKKYDEAELMRKLIFYREKKRLEEEASQAGDDQSEKSSDDNDDGSENDSDSDDDNLSVASGESGPAHITLKVVTSDDEKVLDEIEERYSPRPGSGMQRLKVSGSSEV